MKKFIEEFKEFIAKGNALQMAIGVVIGGAFGAITNSLVADVITPLLAAIFKSPNTDALNITLRAATADSEAIVLGLGTFVGAVINFRSRRACRPHHRRASRFHPRRAEEPEKVNYLQQNRTGGRKICRLYFFAPVRNASEGAFSNS